MDLNLLKSKNLATLVWAPKPCSKVQKYPMTPNSKNRNALRNVGIHSIAFSYTCGYVF
jgi:hypothetical protein